MKIVTSLLSNERETTLDALLNMDMNNLFSYWVENPEHRDFLKAYSLVKGVEIEVVDRLNIESGNLVTIVFLDLKLA